MSDEETGTLRTEKKMLLHWERVRERYVENLQHLKEALDRLDFEIHKIKKKMEEKENG